MNQTIYIMCLACAGHFERRYIFLSFFDVDHCLKSLLNLLQYCFCFMFWFFDCEACEILAP